MKTTKEQLTLQQQRFCDEYLVSFNAMQSAIKAGYSKSTARKCELLHLPKIQAYLQQGMKRTSERLEISHDMILREFAKVAFASMGDYYDENGVLIPINQLTPDQRAAIQQYQLIDCIGDYAERAGEISKIKLHNKMAALDKIARHTGFYAASQRSKSKVQSQKSGLMSPEPDGELDGGEVEKVLTISPVEEESRVGNRESKEEEKSENILTISPHDLMEDGIEPARPPAVKMKDVERSAENILTFSPLAGDDGCSQERLLSVG